MQNILQVKKEEFRQRLRQDTLRALFQQNRQKFQESVDQWGQVKLILSNQQFNSQAYEDTIDKMLVSSQNEQLIEVIELLVMNLFELVPLQMDNLCYCHVCKMERNHECCQYIVARVYERGIYKLLDLYDLYFLQFLELYLNMAPPIDSQNAQLICEYLEKMLQSLNYDGIILSLHCLYILTKSQPQIITNAMACNIVKLFWSDFQSLGLQILKQFNWDTMDQTGRVTIEGEIMKLLFNCNDQDQLLCCKILLRMAQCGQSLDLVDIVAYLNSKQQNDDCVIIMMDILLLCNFKGRSYDALIQNMLNAVTSRLLCYNSEVISDKVKLFLQQHSSIVKHHQFSQQMEQLLNEI